MFIIGIAVQLGLVPATELGRIYAEELGRANQLIAAQADDVYFMAAGLPLTLKGPNHKGISPVRQPPILAISNDPEDELISHYTLASAVVGLKGLNCELFGGPSKYEGRIVERCLVSRRVATTHTSPTQIAARHAAQSKCASDGSRPIPG